MKLKISDMMDHVESIPVEMQEKNIASAKRIKEATVKKIGKTQSKIYVMKKISRVGIVAAVIVSSLCVAAAAVVKWGGFAFTNDMNDTEKKAFIKDASMIYSREYEDKNGNVHYLDENGNEVMVLSEAEAAKYELERKAAMEQAVKESTKLVDVSTLQFTPHIITELPTNTDGEFAEFALGNASMILLHPENRDGFDLEVGDIVTIALDANDKCILEFGQFKDGVSIGTETVSAQQHSYSITIEEAGLYCFSVEYRSAGVSTFTNCTITIN